MNVPILTDWESPWPNPLPVTLCRDLNSFIRKKLIQSKTYDLFKISYRKYAKCIPIEEVKKVFSEGQLHILVYKKYLILIEVSRKHYILKNVMMDALLEYAKKQNGLVDIEKKYRRFKLCHQVKG